jgi:O-methyltransferase
MQATARMASVVSSTPPARRRLIRDVRPLHNMLKSSLRHLLKSVGLEVRRAHKLPANAAAIPDSDLYRPLFSPWLGQKEFQRYYDIAAPKTLVSPDRCYVLYTLIRQAIRIDGDIWECGVYKGGTAAMMAAMLKDSCPSKRLYLFDTFEGMPETDADKDLHKKGDFSDTSIEAVTSYIGHEDLCVVRKGFIPMTFSGLESARIAFAHIDVDIYKSIIDCLQFIWPRLTFGGFVVFDDYGFPTCPGARTAVDEFFLREACVPLCLPTGQALVFKGAA